MVQYEEKFITINKRHLKEVPEEKLEAFNIALKGIQPFMPNNRYYVCNQDEPYAREVLKLIIFDEIEKQMDQVIEKRPTTP